MFFKNGTETPESATHWEMGDSRSRRRKGEEGREKEKKKGKKHERNIKRDMDMWEGEYAISEHFS